MLLVGTSRGLRDLDSNERFVEGKAVTALATAPADGWYALLDRKSVVRSHHGVREAVEVGELAEPDGQSLAVLGGGTVVVGRTNARLSIISPGGEVSDVPAFLEVPGREAWENPAAPTPDTRSMDVGTCRWWVNVHVGGVWWSEDAGGTWHGPIGPEADVHEVRTGTNGQVAVAAVEAGLDDARQVLLVHPFE